MKRKMTLVSILGVALTLLCTTANSHAALMETTITATVDSISGSTAALYWNIGDSFTVSALYDDAGTVMHEWNDGANGTADFGAPDDTISETYDITDPLYASDYSFFADAIFSFDSNTQGLMASEPDIYNVNYAMAYLDVRPPFDVSFFDYQADSLRFVAAYPTLGPLSDGGGYIFTNSTRTEFSIDQVVTTAVQAQPVPEPTTLFLLGTGIAVLAGSRMRRKKVT